MFNHVYSTVTPKKVLQHVSRMQTRSQLPHFPQVSHLSASLFFLRVANIVVITINYSSWQVSWVTRTVGNITKYLHPLSMSRRRFTQIHSCNSSPRTGLLIGSQGANIKELRRDSGCKALRAGGSRSGWTLVRLYGRFHKWGYPDMVSLS